MVTSAPLIPVTVATKLVMSTPVTATLNVTVKSTLVAFVGFAPARTIDCTMGAVVLMTMALFAPSELAAPGTARVNTAALPARSRITPPLSASANWLV